MKILKFDVFVGSEFCGSFTGSGEFNLWNIDFIRIEENEPTKIRELFAQVSPLYYFQA